jgi:hypothetical protein
LTPELVFPVEISADKCGGKIQVKWALLNRSHPLNAMLVEVLTRKGRFAFGVCARCRVKVFPVAPRGKQRRYCNPACQAKAAPSAKKRPEYVKRSRKKSQDRDIEVVSGKPE